jgi:membrane protein
VLLLDPARTPLAPLLASLCLPLEPGSEALWRASGWQRLTLAQALPRPDAAPRA